MSKTTTADHTAPVSDTQATSEPLETEVLEFRANFEARSPLDEIVREGARRMLQQAIDAEVQGFLAQHADRRDEQGRRQVVRNGQLPSREILTGAGPLEVVQPRVRDTSPDKDHRVTFSPSVLPPYLRKSKAIEEWIPWLYLKGVSTGDFGDALQSLVGEGARGLSANVVVRLSVSASALNADKEAWSLEYDAWMQRDLSDKHYVYVWADGIHAKVRLEDDPNQKPCLLVLMGATADGHKELITVIDGYRESKQSWREVLLDLMHRGLSTAPKLAVGDGALGFWAALREVFPGTREQRCWVHKTANVLNKLPRGVQPQAKGDRHEIWQAETREEAHTAFDPGVASWRRTPHRLEKYAAKYEAACECLKKDRDVSLTFYDFPAEHWRHLRTTNPIESTFATIRLRHRRTQGNGTRRASLTMMFKLAQSAQKGWRRLNGHALILPLLEGRTFQNGLLQDAA